MYICIRNTRYQVLIQRARQSDSVISPAEKIQICRFCTQNSSPLVTSSTDHSAKPQGKELEIR